MRILLVILITLSTTRGACAAEVGPDTGTLVVVGGAARSSEIYDKFIELAGGKDAKIVVIPTAGGQERYPTNWGGLSVFHSHGVSNVVLLHTYDPKEADTDTFAKPLKDADAVWFSGGRQWRLVDSYLNTKVHKELNRLLARGGVIGGSSAGATIQGSYLARGDTKTNTIMMGDHEEGLGFLKNVAIDQHLLRRNRQFDLIEIIEAKPQLLGIGVDENTAIVVRGDVAEVIGDSYVAFYRHEGIEVGKPFVLVAPGQRYHLSQHRIFQPRRIRPR